MEIGIHAFVWTDGQNQQDLERAMEKAREVGYSLIEFPGLDAKKYNIDRLAKRADELKLHVSASAGLTPDLDVSSDDPAIVQRGEAFLHDAVKVARDLGSRQMSGPMFSAHQKYRSLPTRKGWQTSAAALSRVAEKAKAANVSLSLEIVNRYETNLMNTVSQGIEFIKETGSDNIFLHLDTFHMNMEEADPAQAIRLAGNYIGYFHVGESNRSYLGSGSIDFAAIFDALVDIGYSKNITVEAFDSNVLGDWIKVICAIWRDAVDNGTDFARHAKAFVEMRYAEAQRRASVYRVK